jgi:hypothetical protein
VATAAPVAAVIEAPEPLFIFAAAPTPPSEGRGGDCSIGDSALVAVDEDVRVVALAGLTTSTPNPPPSIALGLTSAEQRRWPERMTPSKAFGGRKRFRQLDSVRSSVVIGGESAATPPARPGALVVSRSYCWHKLLGLSANRRLPLPIISARDEVVAIGTERAETCPLDDMLVDVLASTPAAAAATVSATSTAAAA